MGKETLKEKYENLTFDEQYDIFWGAVFTIAFVTMLVAGLYYYANGVRGDMLFINSFAALVVVMMLVLGISINL